MNELKLKKGILIGCMISAALLLGFIGSYAYFISTGDNNKNQSTSVQTGNMALTFSDGISNFQGTLNFGESATKTFTIENTGSLEAKANINWLNLINTYLKESLTYSFSYSESEDGEYTEIVTNKKVPVSETAITKTLANNLTIPASTKYYYKLEITLNYLEDIDQTPDLNAILSTEFSIEEGIEKSLETLRNLGLRTKTETPNFAETATTDETKEGLYALEDDYGTSYYFRGAAANNYVKFGESFWRIIRINGDGSLRMIYDGTSAHPNGESNIDRTPINNINYNSYDYKRNNKAVGYMYGGAANVQASSYEETFKNETNSILKTNLDSWYKTNIEDKGYTKYVSDTIFCNDRSTPGFDISEYEGDTGLGYGNNPTTYGGYTRLINGKTNALKDNPKPSYKCEQNNDKFTVDITKGNGALQYPVGTITADELTTAGFANAYTSSNSNLHLNYLYKGHQYWTMTPFYLNTRWKDACVFIAYGSIPATDYGVASTISAAPVINIKQEYTFYTSGNGNIDNPYVLEIDNQL